MEMENKFEDISPPGKVYTGKSNAELKLIIPGRIDSWVRNMLLCANDARLLPKTKNNYWDSKNYDDKLFLKKVDIFFNQIKLKLKSALYAGHLNCDLKLLYHALTDTFWLDALPQKFQADRPILVFRFYSPTMSGLKSRKQKESGNTLNQAVSKISETNYFPIKENKLLTKVRGKGAQQFHQQGVFKEGNLNTGHHTLSSLVSCTCSLANFIYTSAGLLPAQPGGSVSEIIFGPLIITPNIIWELNTTTNQAEAKTQFGVTVSDKCAPKIGLFLLPPHTYCNIDWTPNISSSNQDSQRVDPLVSYYEREVCFNSDNNAFSNDDLSRYLIYMWENPFKNTVIRK